MISATTIDGMELTGQVAVVTGARGGLGAGISSAFAAAGAAVVVHYRNSAESAARMVADIVAMGRTRVLGAMRHHDPDSCMVLMATTVDALAG